jgi:predicted DNA-binding transcriptional regulator YafY
MRADRLISLLLILQHNGRKTAQELAEELEVSERTIYRDVIALCTAGVPVYTERGPGGGIRLVESYRTTLTGLSPDEVEALFMFSVPAAMMDLGVSDQFRQAYLKLSASLSGSQQEAERRVRQRVLIDAEGGADQKGAGERVSKLQNLYRAVWGDLLVTLTVNYHFGVQYAHQVEAYSLVASGTDWFLVGRVDGNYQVFDFQLIDKVVVNEASFKRDLDFDLETFWRTWLDEYSSRSWRYPVEMWVSPELLKQLEGRRIYELLPGKRLDGAREDWLLIATNFKNFGDALFSILNYGGASMVVKPIPLRLSVADYAEQIMAVYGSPHQGD